MDIKKLLRAELLAMKGYTPIEPVEVLEEQLDRKVIKLDGNENPYGCSPKVLSALAAYPYYHIYPDPQQRKLGEALEKYTGISRQNIVCGSGSDELIDLVLRLFLEPGDRVINCPPTFGMYPFCTGVCGGKVIEVPRKEDFALDIPGIKKALDKKTKVIFIASPNNPTGNVAAEEELLELVDTGRVVVVDEAYYEFSGTTVAKLVPGYPNLVVLRTFSKWAGLAGLRVGYGIFPGEIAGYLMEIKQPYNINVAAQVAVLASLDDIDYLRDNIKKIVAERDRLSKRLGELGGLTLYPSRANFVLCSLWGMPTREIWQELRKKGIFVRYFDAPRLKDCLRISAGKPENTDALVEALKALPGHCERSEAISSINKMEV